MPVAKKKPTIVPSKIQAIINKLNKFNANTGWRVLRLDNDLAKIIPLLEIARCELINERYRETAAELAEMLQADVIRTRGPNRQQVELALLRNGFAVKYLKRHGNSYRVIETRHGLLLAD